MVINVGALKGRDYGLVLEDIRQVVDASKPYPVKSFSKPLRSTTIRRSSPARSPKRRAPRS